MHRTAVVLAALLLAGAAVNVHADTHPFNVRDLVAFERITAIEVSPDRASIVIEVSRLDLEANGRTHDLWLLDPATSEPKRLTTHAANDLAPAWAPDGRSVWFLSSRSGTTQVWNISVEDGEARQVTRFPLDVNAFRLSRDGAKLAVSADVFPDCDGMACTAERLGTIASRKASGRIYDRLPVRHWDAWKDGRRGHLFVLPATGEGEAVDVMRGIDADAPTKPWGGPEEFTFTPDGAAVVFTAKNVGREEMWSTDADLWVAAADGSGEPRKLTGANPAWDGTPSFSPDGRTLAWIAQERPGYESDRFRIVTMAWPDGAPRVRTDSWDRSVKEFAWSADGKTIWATADDLGHLSLFGIDAASGEARLLVRSGTAKLPRDAGGRVVFSLEHFRSPAEVHSVRADGSDLRQVGDLNGPRLAAIRMGEYEPFEFTGWNGETVHGWVVMPVDLDRSKRYPVAFLIHGGPQGSFQNEFHYRWNPQAYAGAGYAAVMVDFHGSTGYGQAFTDSIRLDWGGKPLEDLRKGLAAVLGRYPWMDGERVAALGASYGGFMINWISGNWPDRFRCLVNHDGNLDERMAYFDTEELWFPEWDHGGTPWDNPEGYDGHNPVEHVAKWKTPMLVIHGALDFRVVETQGMSTFTALQRRGIPSKLLYFPDENHWVRKPHNSILWHDTVIEWLDTWTR